MRFCLIPYADRRDRDDGEKLSYFNKHYYKHVRATVRRINNRWKTNTTTRGKQQCVVSRAADVCDAPIDRVPAGPNRTRRIPAVFACTRTTVSVDRTVQRSRSDDNSSARREEGNIVDVSCARTPYRRGQVGRS